MPSSCRSRSPRGLPYYHMFHPRTKRSSTVIVQRTFFHFENNTHLLLKAISPMQSSTAHVQYNVVQVHVHVGGRHVLR